MTINLHCEVKDGLIPGEKVVSIQRADGRLEEVTVSVRNMNGNRLEASEIGRNESRVLVELPRESASGRWRVWVKESSVGA
jgi:hypothetical protein